MRLNIKTSQIKNRGQQLDELCQTIRLVDNHNDEMHQMLNSQDGSARRKRYHKQGTMEMVVGDSVR